MLKKRGSPLNSYLEISSFFSQRHHVSCTYMVKEQSFQTEICFPLPVAQNTFVRGDISHISSHVLALLSSSKCNVSSLSIWLKMLQPGKRFMKYGHCLCYYCEIKRQIWDVILLQKHEPKHVGEMCILHMWKYTEHCSSWTHEDREYKDVLCVCLCLLHLSDKQRGDGARYFTRLIAESKMYLPPNSCCFCTWSWSGWTGCTLTEQYKILTG